MLEILLESFDIKEDCKTVVGGDFNIIFDKHLDADGGSPCLKVGIIKKLMDIMSEWAIPENIHTPLWTTLNWVPKNFRISKKNSCSFCRIPEPANSKS